MKLILINGPRSSGKDHSARHLIDFYVDRTIVFERFSRPIKEAFAAMMGVGLDEYFNVDDYERNKLKPIPLLGNISFVQWQIDFSEKFMKPLYGNSIFAKLMLHRLDEYQHIFPFQDYGEIAVVIPDVGFQIEIDEIVKEFPSEDILLLRLERPGFTFEGDSREYVETRGDFRGETILNDSTVAEFETRLRTIVESFIGVKKDA